jgi:hypothetical protein
MSATPSRKTPPPAAPDDGPLMPFNEALKRVWSAPPAPRVAAKLQTNKKARKP